MAEAFYPFVENGETDTKEPQQAICVRHPARIAVFDDAAAAPRVVVVEPSDIRTYLEEITATVTRLAQEQGGRIPFTVVREVVENLIHAYFIEPTVSILDGGNTIRFSDQGPGIQDKDRALQYGTTSATAEMKRYIRGVGSGLPYAQQWLEDKGGSLTVEDNIHNGTVVTVSLERTQGSETGSRAAAMVPGLAQVQQGAYPGEQQVAQRVPSWPSAPDGMMQAPQPAYPYPPQQSPQQSYQQGWGYPQPAQQQPWPQQGYPQQTWPQQVAYPQQQAQQASPLTEREAAALDYLRGSQSVGPRDLVALHGLSESTWSRVLSSLEERGLVSKQGGQKRRLTDLGRAFLGI